MPLRRLILRRLLIGLVLLLLAFLVDRQAFSVLRVVTLYDHSGEVREGLTAAKFLASGLGTLCIAVAVAVLDRRGRRRAGALLVVAAASGLVGVGAKVLAGRERPSHLDQAVGRERLEFGGPAAGSSPYFQSFPSGHTLNAFAVATCLASFYPPARVVVYPVAAACGVNRVVKHQHFLSDVVAGALAGHLLALWLLALPGVLRLWREEPVDSSSPSP